MNNMIPLLSIITSLKAGNTLSNPKLWKLLQICINISATLAPIISIFYPEFSLSKEEFMELAAAVASFNAYFTVATTDKIGV